MIICVVRSLTRRSIRLSSPSEHTRTAGCQSPLRSCSSRALGRTECRTRYRGHHTVPRQNPQETRFIDSRTDAVFHQWADLGPRMRRNHGQGMNPNCRLDSSEPLDTTCSSGSFTIWRPRPPLRSALSLRVNKTEVGIDALPCACVLTRTRRPDGTLSARLRTTQKIQTPPTNGTIRVRAAHLNVTRFHG